MKCFVRAKQVMFGIKNFIQNHFPKIGVVGNCCQLPTSPERGWNMQEGIVWIKFVLVEHDCGYRCGLNNGLEPIK